MKWKSLSSFLSIAVSVTLVVSCTGEAPKKVSLEDKKPAEVQPLEEGNKTVVVAAGCFWCIEAIFEPQPGIINVVSGFAGGPEQNPTYDQVSAGQTGHTEVIKIDYNPSQTNLDTILSLFWKSFDASDARGVAPDFGPQYRHVLFYSTPEEKEIMEASKKAEQTRIKKPVATTIEAFEAFWPAEKYHQDYVKNNPNNPYVRGVSIPRMIETGVDPKLLLLP